MINGLSKNAVNVPSDVCTGIFQDNNSSYTTTVGQNALNQLSREPSPSLTERSLC